MPKTIFFDLDGTLTDSGPGIMNCARLMLDRKSTRLNSSHRT